MSIPFRVIDTGIRPGRLQIAFDEALIEQHKQGRVPDSVRFLRFRPTVLIGRHQALSREVKVAECRANGIDLVRRITGGGAIYLDQGQVGWELVLSRQRMPMPTLADYARAICEAIAHGLSTAFGIDATYRPRSDIVVDGRKLCGTGGFFDGDTLIYQGTVLVDVAPARLLQFLNVPRASSPTSGASAAPEQRLVTLEELLGGAVPDVADVHRAVLSGLSERLGIEPRSGMPSAEEEAMAQRLHDEEIGTEAFLTSIDNPGGAGVLEAMHAGPGGRLTTHIRIEGDGAARRIREIVISGDYFLTPPRLVLDLEASLRGVSVDAAGAAAESWLRANAPSLATFAPGDVRKIIEAALATG